MNRVLQEAETVARTAWRAHGRHDHGPNVKVHMVNGDWEVPPVVFAAYSRNRKNAILWCPWCDTWHVHGAGNGGRAAHCSVPDSPFKATGYIIQMVEGVHYQVLKPPRRERRRPKLDGTLLRHGWDEVRQARGVRP